MKRITIVGNSGSGKSTLAQIINRLLHHQVHHLDSILWQSGWSKLPDYEQKRVIEDILQGNEWIIEGNHLLSQPACFLNSDTIIFLDLPRQVCLSRVLFRTIRYLGQGRPDLAQGCSERLNLKLLKDVWYYHNSSRQLIFNNIKQYGNNSTLVILKTSREVSSFISFIRYFNYKIEPEENIQYSVENLCETILDCLAFSAFHRC